MNQCCLICTHTEQLRARSTGQWTTSRGHNANTIFYRICSIRDAHSLHSHYFILPSQIFLNIPLVFFVRRGTMDHARRVVDIIEAVRFCGKERGFDRFKSGIRDWMRRHARVQIGIVRRINLPVRNPDRRPPTQRLNGSPR